MIFLDYFYRKDRDRKGLFELDGNGTVQAIEKFNFYDRLELIADMSHYLTHQL